LWGRQAYRRAAGSRALEDTRPGTRHPGGLRVVPSTTTDELLASPDGSWSWRRQADDESGLGPSVGERDHMNPWDMRLDA